MTLAEKVNNLKMKFFEKTLACMTPEDIEQILSGKKDWEHAWSKKFDKKLDELYDYDYDWYLEFFRWATKKLEVK